MDSDVERLNEVFGRAGAVAFVEHPLGGVAAELVTPQAEAEVALHGAHVLSFKPRAGSEVLWMSPEARIADGEGIRGGIPVCWPWFAAHASDASKPDHGFVRKAPWRVVRTAHQDGAALIEMAFPLTAEHAKLWPSHAEVGVIVTLTDTLRVDLLTHNAGQDPFELTQALHTYFTVGAVADTEVHGLNGRTYLDKLQGFARRQQTGPITFAGEVDRIYENTADDVVIRDAANGRNIRVAKAGSTSTVVWNPWIDKSARLSHMPPGAYLGMLCVETTNAGGDVVTLVSRARHRLTTIISVQPI